MKLSHTEFEVAPLAPPENLLQSASNERYQKIINNYRQLFEIARYPNTSTHVCEQSLVINVAPQYGVFSTHALIQVIQSRYGRFSAGYDKADGFSVMWYDKEPGQNQRLTHVDRVHSGDEDVSEWLARHEDRSSNVHTMLRSALLDDELNSISYNYRA